MNDNVFTINENVRFNFKSKDKEYLLRVNIIEGIIILNEINGEELVDKNIIFLGDRESYVGEIKKEVKKKRGRKKKSE